MNSRPLMTVRITAAPPQKLGAVPHGMRSIVPVTGGDFEGARLREKVLPGGGDWLLLRSDGVLELDLRITLETDDQALIDMRFQGPAMAGRMRSPRSAVEKWSIPRAITFERCPDSRPRRRSMHS